MLRVEYKDIRDNLSIGDLVAFGGRGLTSHIIKKVTRSNVSHVGVVLTHHESLIMLIESTSLGKGHAGVKINRLSDLVQSYRGDIWVLPLSGASSQRLDKQAFNDFMLTQVGKPYDAPQAILSALDLLPDSREDYSRMYCSELILAGYKYGKLVDHDVNPSEETPIDICKRPLYALTVQIKGETKELC